MLKSFSYSQIGVGLLAAAFLALFITGCPSQQAALDDGENASKVYNAPGDHDELYAFLSGGYDGQVSVWGLPSARFMKQIPVFSQHPETGYGYSEETKALLQSTHGFIPWDDTHHPHLSRTDGEADGRWMYINANNTPRIARVDLTDFETKETIEIPNTAGNHGSSFVTANSEYVVGATRFSVPTPNRDVPIDQYENEFQGTITFLGLDEETGEMDLSFQILAPPFNYDLARPGHGASHGWAFFTSYNTEQAHTLLERGASQADKDYVVAVNWKKAEQYVEEGRAERVEAEYYHNKMDDATGIAVSETKDSVLMLDPADVEDMIYFIPTPKSPHGIDVSPDGEYLAAGGKLATVIPVHSFSNMLEAIENEDFEEVIDGIPVLNYDAVIHAEVEDPGLGPLHTEYDGEGYAYTSAYISSEIVKWSLDTFEVVDRIPSYYSIGHLMIPGGDTVNPFGQYMISMNKTTRDRHLPTGPKQNHAAQLYDISGGEMEMILDFVTIGEPHYAQAIEAGKITENMKNIYDLADNEHPRMVRSSAQARVEREGDNVHVYMAAIRSHFTPDNIEGIREGDTVHFHVTNVEQDWDMVHGIGIMGATNAEILVPPGKTKTMVWEPQSEGIYPFYCTAFCSALHQEMQGYVRVSPEGADTELLYYTGDRPDGA